MIKQRRAYEVDGKIFMKKAEAVEYTKRLEEAREIAARLAKAVNLIREVRVDIEDYDFGDSWTGYVGYLNDFLRYYEWVGKTNGIDEYAKELVDKEKKDDDDLNINEKGL